MGMTRSENMRRIRSKNTAPEMIVRKLVHSMGYRYRLHRKDLPGNPDLVFPGRRKVIFVHGCFWHSHGCKNSHTPKSNDTYWSPKLVRNKERDEEAQEKLLAMDWRFLVIWECQIKDCEALTGRLTQFLSS